MRESGIGGVVSAQLLRRVSRSRSDEQNLNWCREILQTASILRRTIFAISYCGANTGLQHKIFLTRDQNVALLSGDGEERRGFTACTGSLVG